jgi:hypothetical protein
VQNHKHNKTLFCNKVLHGSWKFVNTVLKVNTAGHHGLHMQSQLLRRLRQETLLSQKFETSLGNTVRAYLKSKKQKNQTGFMDMILYHHKVKNPKLNILHQAGHGGAHL